MKHKKEVILGMEMDVWCHKSCRAEVGVGDDWATIYSIGSVHRNEGHAQELLEEARKHYEGESKKFGGTVALNSTMKHIYEKLNILEYAE